MTDRTPNVDEPQAHHTTDAERKGQTFLPRSPAGIAAVVFLVGLIGVAGWQIYRKVAGSADDAGDAQSSPSANKTGGTQSAEARRIYRKAYYEDDPAKAIELCTQALELDPDFALAYNHRGNVYCDLAEYERAVADYRRAVEAEPELAIGWYNIGLTLHQKMGRATDALPALDRALQLDPEYADALSVRGKLYKDLDRYEEAADDLRRCLEHGGSRAAWAHLGYVREMLGRKEQAYKDYERAVAEAPDRDIGWFHRGRSYRDRGRYEEALADFNRAIEITPSFADAYKNRGMTYERMGDFENALDDYVRAVNSLPSYQSAWANMADLLRREGYYENALVAANNAIRFAPDYARAYRISALCWLALDNADGARANARKCAELGGRLPEELSRLLAEGEGP